MAAAIDYKGLIRQFSIILLIVLAVYLALVRPLAKQGINMLQSQIEEGMVQLEKYIPQGDAKVPLPSAKTLQALEASLAQDEENYQSLKNFIDPQEAFLPEGTQEAGLYFIQQLHIKTKMLKRQANTLKIKIPNTFGFSEEMPEDTEDVEFLLRELDLVQRLTTLLMEEGVEEISLVKALSLVEQRDQQTQKLFYRELPVQLSFLCSSSTLVKFLYQIKNFSPVLIAKDIIIKRTEGLSLQVEMLLAGVAVW